MAYDRRMFGSHLSIAGSMVNALDEARALGLDTVQVFTKNQQQWKAPPLDPGMVRAWCGAVASLGWQGRIVSHASYLINLASVKDDLWRQSVDLMQVEIERCEELGIAYLVHHPGSFVGSDLDTGLSRIAAAYAELFRRTPGYKVVCCLEGTAGAGSSIGGRFEHLRDLRARIVEATGSPGRVGYCLDTCHLHAAGYDMSTRGSARGVLGEFDAMCGVGHLRVWHVNDSKGALGSHLDRHEHIGEGCVGGGKPGVASPARLAASGFAEIVQDPVFAGVPKILETPKGEDKAGKPLDSMNLRRLRALLSEGQAPKTASKRRVRAGVARSSRTGKAT
jgi:deoxyribonuclease IV